MQVSDTLSVDVATNKVHLLIRREGGGLVHIQLDEVKGLVNALTELAARAAAEASGQEYVGPDDLW